jgi:ribosomal protein L11 methyltransferase
MKPWWAVTVTAGPEVEGTELAEVLWYRLSELCSANFYEDRTRPYYLRGWLASTTPEAALHEFQRQVGELSTDVAVSWELADDEDWNEAFKKQVRPQPVGERFFVCPIWFEIPPEAAGRLVIRTEPGLAFGTGQHQTTQLCLNALAQHVRPGQTFADVGCGSGILTVGGLLLGAAHAWAVDTDPLTIDPANAHLQFNQVADRAEVRLGSTEVLDTAVDGIVSNILAEVIVPLAPEFARLAKPGTWGIFSGLLTSQAGRVETALRAVGWQPLALTTEDDWGCLVGRF